MLLSLKKTNRTNVKLSLKLLVFGILFITKNIYGQSLEVLLAKYKPEILKQANTADTCTYLTEQEKKTIQLCNLARINGKLFKENLILNYPEVAGNLNNNKYVSSLLKDIEKINNLPLLQPNYFYYHLAKQHATDMGISGQVGHNGSDQRFNKMIKKTAAYKCSENCDYGYDKAIDIVMHLLIDDGVVSLGHRKSILDKDFNSIGVSIMSHKKYEYNCVQLFAATGEKQELSFWKKMLFWKKNISLN